MRLHAAAAPLRPPLGARALDGRAGRRARRASPARDVGRGRVALAARCSSARERPTDELRATYRLQLGPDLRLRDARGARAVPARARRLPPLPLAGAPGARAARRTATTWSTRGASRESSAASAALRALCEAGARRRCSTSSRTTWRPSDAEPVLARPGAARAVLRPRRGDGPPPALLRRRRARRRARRGARGVRDDAPARARPRRARGSSTACAIDHPDGLADPRGYLERLRDEGVERIWVEKILEPGERLRDWPVEGTTGYEFLNDVAGALRRPGRRGGADRARGRAAAVARGRGRGEARAGDDDLPARGRAAAAAARRARPRARARVAAGLPHLRRAVERPRRGRRPRGGRRRCPTDAAPRAAARGARPRRVRHALPADDRPGDGEGRRGHGLLPLRPPARAERGRRRSRALRALRRGVPPRERRARRALPAHAAARDDARHEAQRRRARADRRARRDGRALARARPALARADRAAPRAATHPTGRRSCSSTRRSSAPGRSSRDRLEPYLEKALREAKRNTSWVEPERALGEARQALRARAATSTSRSSPTSSRSRREVAAAGRALGARPARAAAHLARRARHLPRRRAAVLRARRSRQPPAGRLGRAPRRARARAMRRTASRRSCT